MNSPLEQLEQRLLKLEEQNRRLAKSNRAFKIANVSVVLVVFCLVAIGWKAQSNVADVIEAKRFVLKDENGMGYTEWKLTKNNDDKTVAELVFGSPSNYSVRIKGAPFAGSLDDIENADIVVRSKGAFTSNSITRLESNGIEIRSYPNFGFPIDLDSNRENYSDQTSIYASGAYFQKKFKFTNREMLHQVSIETFRPKIAVSRDNSGISLIQEPSILENVFNSNKHFSVKAWDNDYNFVWP